MEKYTTVRLKSWDKYKEFVDKLSTSWIFRGQLMESWDLATSWERTTFNKSFETVESSFLTYFQRGVFNFIPSTDQPSSILEWLALMQHHGAPTRLLDFSWSPYIAAFFSFEKAFDEYGNTAIWAIDSNRIKESVIEYTAEKFKKYRNISNVIPEELIEKIVFENSSQLIVPVEPFRQNHRYYLQQGLFISTGNSLDPFMEQLEFLGIKSTKAIYKLILPAYIQTDVMIDLFKMNITRASLFPDLDGFARTIHDRFAFIYNNPDSSKKLLDEYRFLGRLKTESDHT